MAEEAFITQFFDVKTSQQGLQAAGEADPKTHA